MSTESQLDYAAARRTADVHAKALNGKEILEKESVHLYSDAESDGRKHDCGRSGGKIGLANAANTYKNEAAEVRRSDDDQRTRRKERYIYAGRRRQDFTYEAAETAGHKSQLIRMKTDVRTVNSQSKR